MELEEIIQNALSDPEREGLEVEKAIETPEYYVVFFQPPNVKPGDEDYLYDSFIVIDKSNMEEVGMQIYEIPGIFDNYQEVML